LVIVVVIIVGGVLSSIGGRGVAPGELAVGDCLYVRTSASALVDHPIGPPQEVAAALLAGDGESADCTASHGHEVSEVLDLKNHPWTAEEAEKACATAFRLYVGRELTGSRYITFAALPEPVSPPPEPGLGFCLVARADGNWMDHPARGSGE
jgi:hypothetical protein